MREIERLSGWRKVGRIYISGSIIEHQKPMELPQVCPVCNTGVKPSRGLSRFSGKLLNGSLEDGFIAWAGIRFYKTRLDYVREAVKHGASVTLNAVPHGLSLYSLVHIAHAKGVYRSSKTVAKEHDLPMDTQFSFPSVICSFYIEHIEMVCRSWQSEDELLMHSLKRRGIDAVFVNEDKKFEPLKRASGVLRDQ